MKQLRKARLASAALSAALLLQINPVTAQESAPPSSAPEIPITPPPVAEPTTPPVTAPQPTPIVTQPAVDPPTAITVEPEERPARTERAAQRRTAASPARAQTIRVPARQPVPVEPAPAAAPSAVAPATAPAAQAAPLPLPAPIPVDTPAPAPAASQASDGMGYWPWLIGAALLAGLILLVAARRRRSRIHDDYRTEAFRHDPVSAPEPVAAAPEQSYGDDYVPADPFGDAPQSVEHGSLAHPAPAAAALAVEPEGTEPAPTSALDEVPATTAGRLDQVDEGLSSEPVADVETIEVTEPDAEELAALTGGETVAERPWLELMMRPVRAGTTEDEARVEFELTVGNNGSVPAEAVRVSSWMFPAGSVQPSAMERMLIEPPLETRIGDVTIPPGHGAKIAASISMPRSRLSDPVLPVVVADARYPLPDGGEGRISASFAIGHMVGEEIEPFSVDQPSGLDEAVASRLYGDVHSA